MNRIARVPLLVPTILALALGLAACGGDDESATKTDVPRSKSPAEVERAAASRDRLAGSEASTDTAAGAATASLGDCLVAAGFAAAPPGHGIVAQWSHSDGTVVAQSTDPAQAKTQAAEFTSSDAPAKVVGDGVIIAGSGASADAARTCATA